MKVGTYELGVNRPTLFYVALFTGHMANFYEPGFAHLSQGLTEPFCYSHEIAGSTQWGHSLIHSPSTH